MSELVEHITDARNNGTITGSVSCVDVVGHRELWMKRVGMP